MQLHQRLIVLSPLISGIAGVQTPAAVEEKAPDRAFRGVPTWNLQRVLRWFTGDIGIHHIHDLCNAIPNYRLQKCMDKVQGLPTPHRLTFWTSLRCARLSLWNLSVCTA